MAVEIVEVLRRSDQGMTRPFICRGDDGETYFVKGVGAGRRSQICEWIAGNLGMAINLPLAPFEIVHVSDELVAFDMGLELNQLGSGPAFGSRERRVTEVTYPVIEDIPDALQQDVLIFDWWILNGDRYFSESGGNPNLFWQPGEKELVVIDHNQAFDGTIDREYFKNNHIFKRQLSGLSGDFFCREEYNDRLTTALQGWDTIVEQIPESWYFADKEMTVPVNFDLDTAHRILARFSEDDFWN